MGDEEGCFGRVFDSGERAKRATETDARRARRDAAEARSCRLSEMLGVSVRTRIDANGEATDDVLVSVADLEAIAQQLKNEFG